jgi:hypothetical protein
MPLPSALADYTSRLALLVVIRLESLRAFSQPSYGRSDLKHSEPNRINTLQGEASERAAAGAKTLLIVKSIKQA